VYRHVLQGRLAGISFLPQRGPPGNDAGHRPAQDTEWPLNDNPNITMYPFNPEGPYHCILIAAGTLDTCGGPKTNHLAQVLDTDDTPIPGLYGAGNCIATPTHSYFGGGATIGPALAFGYIAGINAVKESVK